MLSAPWGRSFIAEQSGALVNAAGSAAAGAAVPDCGTWTVTDLLAHVGDTLGFWAWLVGERRLDPHGYRDQRRHAPAGDSRERQAAAIAATRRATADLLDALESTPPATPVWSWLDGRQDVAWVQRRVVHELAVHRFDAEMAAGHDHRLDPTVAADGIAEFLTALARYGPEHGAGTLHLHCTDVAGEWTIDTGAAGPAVAVTEVHAKADAAVRGPAHDVLMTLWGRRAACDVFGNTDVIERFRAAART